MENIIKEGGSKMKISKFKVFAASTALALSLLGNGCYVKLEVKKQPQQSTENKKVEKYRNLAEKILKYDKLVPGKDYAEEKIMMGFDDGTTREEANKIIEGYDMNNELEMMSYDSELNWGVVKVPKGKEQAYVLFFQNMSDETIVKYAELDYIIRILRD